LIVKVASETTLTAAVPVYFEPSGFVPATLYVEESVSVSAFAGMATAKNTSAKRVRTTWTFLSSIGEHGRRRIRAMMAEGVSVNPL
jgi:hypothetical protein